LISVIILGTTTAGDTAPSTAPNIAASIKDIPNNKGAKTIIPRISKVAGRKLKRIAGRPTFIKSFRSKDKPARVKIIIKTICRISAEIFNSVGSKRFNTEGPNKIPTKIKPIKLGIFNFLQNNRRSEERRVGKECRARRRLVNHI